MEHTCAPAAFPERHVLEGRLKKFLEERGLDIGAVIGETDQGLGRPALAVAAGSVLAGFGNHRSDLDLLVLVENDHLTRFPIQSHQHGTLIDVNIRQASAVRDRTAHLRDSTWPRFATVTQEAWNHRRRTIKTASRLALGLELLATGPWQSWHTGLQAPGSRGWSSSGGRSRHTGWPAPPNCSPTNGRWWPRYGAGKPSWPP